VPIALFAATCTLLALTLLAFWPTYLSKPVAAVDGYTHFHAAMGALWLGLLVVQSLLMATKRRRLHRRVGQLAWALAPLFVLSAVLLAHQRFSSMDEATFGAQAYTLYLPLSAALLFGSAFTLALVHRRCMPLHARFMACTALVLVDPVVGRVLAFHVVELPQFWHYQLITFALESAVLVALARSLAAQSRQRQVFARFAAAYAFVLALWFIAAPTPAWQGFADWFRHLPLT
jgi:hypothetical protein